MRAHGCVWTWPSNFLGVLNPYGNTASVCHGLDQNTDQSPSDGSLSAGPRAALQPAGSRAGAGGASCRTARQPSPLFSLEPMCQTACWLRPRPPRRTAAPALRSVRASYMKLESQQSAEEPPGRNLGQALVWARPRLPTPGPPRGRLRGRPRGNYELSPLATVPAWNRVADTRGASPEGCTWPWVAEGDTIICPLQGQDNERSLLMEEVRSEKGVKVRDNEED